MVLEDFDNLSQDLETLLGIAISQLSSWLYIYVRYKTNFNLNILLLKGNILIKAQNIAVRFVMLAVFTVFAD